MITSPQQHHDLKVPEIDLEIDLNLPTMGNTASASVEKTTPKNETSPAKAKAKAPLNIDPTKQQVDGLPPGASPTLSRNFKLYEKADDVDDDSGKPIPELTNEQYQTVTGALGQLFYGSDQPLSEKNKNFLLRKMIRTVVPPKQRVVTEGEEGMSVYVIESGSLDISINGNVIRQLQSGNIFGELALIFNAPRGASVDTVTESVIWTLMRDDFKRMQRDLSAEINANHVTLLKEVPEFKKCLSEEELSLLVSDFTQAAHPVGTNLYSQNEFCNAIMVIEKGCAFVDFNRNLSPVAGSTITFTGDVPPTLEELDSKWGIVSVKNSIDIDISPAEVVEGEGKDEDFPLIFGKKKVAIKLNHGTVIVGPLRSKASLFDSWHWGQSGMQSGSTKTKKFGAVSPFTIKAREHIRTNYFSVSLFTNRIGNPHDVFRRSLAPLAFAPQANDVATEGTIADSAKPPCFLPEHLLKHKYTSESFSKIAYKSVISLGFIGFGVTKTCDDFPEPVTLVLKVFSKKKLLAKNLTKLVYDESRILASLDNPFIVKLLGKYDTRDHIVYVTERVRTIDLWSRIYATNSGTRGLKDEDVQFYGANVLVAIAHMHARKIAFRNLKPENCLIDHEGYLKIVGFGFAKRIPFKLLSSFHHKSYTLCGTPEYLAPEIILNMGHDHGVDMWALGVLLYEMCTGSTPFNSGNDDVVDIIKKIVAIKKTRFHFHHALDDRTHAIRDFIYKCFVFSSAE